MSLFSEDFWFKIWHWLIIPSCDNCGPTQRNAGRSLPSRRLAAEKSYSPPLLDLLAWPRPHLLTSKRKYPLWKTIQFNLPPLLGLVLTFWPQNSEIIFCLTNLTLVHFFTPLTSSPPFDLKTQHVNLISCKKFQSYAFFWSSDSYNLFPSNTIWSDLDFFSSTATWSPFPPCYLLIWKLEHFKFYNLSVKPINPSIESLYLNTPLFEKS